MPQPPIRVAALYRFARFTDPAALRDPLDAVCRIHAVRGTLLLAAEGINGTIAGKPAAVDAVLAHVRTLPGCAALDVKFSGADTMPFHRLKVRVRREIVTMGEPAIDPETEAGTYVEPEDWNGLIADPGTIVIDTRNDYEVAIGSFAGAIDPGTRSFSDFPAWFREQRDALLGHGRQPKVAMFCTGGIRCEKSTAFLKREGVEEVFHLKGGILRYLEAVPVEDSLWQGECFVFDARVSVGHGLAPGTAQLCHACQRPLSAEDQASPLFEAWVSCAGCHGERTEAQRAAYRERHRQITLAAAQGHAHLGRNPSRGQAPDGVPES
ncbi:hypothetical protein PK98_01950 [Croceibacterium mercuriale]|uniref:tRNA uridine(34) hydroxylase n=2 Tax=Croceibacterium mercuriale TaxID=1572751 RepID=A0A0B2C002_9SPHN|nr:hypothetical protein PK98_01950 [Croceibacterium mercuriale]